jgi:hypothetical protein
MTTKTTTAQTAAELAARATIKAAAANESEAAYFAELAAQTPVEAVAYGADGEVLTYEQTVEAIANRLGWFDTQGRWTNKAGFEKQVAAELEAYRTAKRYPN